MVHQLPLHASNRLQPRLKIVWWGRRALFEVIEEVSEGLFRIWIALSVFWWIWPVESIFGLEVHPWGYWLAAAICCVLLSQHAILEILHWHNEIYIVARDDVNGGGRVYKFWGWPGMKFVDESINPSSPTIIFDQGQIKGWLYQKWGQLTGEEMARISTKSANHTFLEGQRISPRFAKAIQEVRGSARQPPELSVGDLHSLDHIKQAMIDGLIPSYLAQDAARTIVHRTIFGEQGQT